MKTKTIDAAHMLIILTAQESRSLGLSPNSICWNSLHCRLAIARIFVAACAGTDFAANKNKIELKAMATADGECVLIFSTDPYSAKPKRKVYKIKTSAGPYVYQFANVGDVLNTIERLYRADLGCSDCTLLRVEGCYRLIISPPYGICSDVSCILKEYGALCGKGKTAAAFAQENGELLCTDAIQTIGMHLI